MSILDSPLPSRFPPWLVITENGRAVRQTGSEVSPSMMGASVLAMRWICKVSGTYQSAATIAEAPVIATAAATTKGLDCSVMFLRFLKPEPGPEAGNGGGGLTGARRPIF